MDLKDMFTRKASGPAPASDDPVQAARLRARQRLVGAALLLVVGIVAFPLLFETKPRPLPLDTPIVAARAPAGGQPGATTAPVAPKPVLRAVPGATSASSAATPPAVAASAPPPAEAPAPVDVPVPAEPAASAATRVAAATPAAPPAPAPVAASAAAEPAGAASAPRAARYVVQVGAFSEATTAREVRTKVERLGLKTYTQVVDTEGGKRTRVRVGPFSSREEAMQTLSRIQAANLPGVVLAL